VNVYVMLPEVFGALPLVEKLPLPSVCAVPSCVPPALTETVSFGAKPCPLIWMVPPGATE